ncbi:MAG TPA: acetolactate synthase small subunit [Candidatus Dormibacteraeota bacterium]|jgi:acetolactate synthase-1/3 small subunit|nr:acetolactate synthase small subunit [Candidatus Dormibacteraeota bacterium]
MTPSESKLRTVNLLVEDHPGVMNRVSGMIRRRGFNIGDLSVGPTNEPGLSRMTLTVDAGHAEVDQVRKQLEKLIEVVDIADLTDDPTVMRELVIARLETADETLVERLASFGGQIIDQGGSEVIIEMTIDCDEAETAVSLLRGYGIKELARSGPVAMRRIEKQ